MNIAFFDLETTGVYAHYDAPIQISSVIIDDSTGEQLASFNEYINTDHPISPEASKVNGITKEMLAGCRREKEVLGDFIEWLITNDIDAIGGHNIVTFDIVMMKERLKLFNLSSKIFDNKKIIDTKELVMYCRKNNICQLKQLGRKWSLVATAKLLNINTDKAHDALADVTMNYKIYTILSKARREYDANR